VAGSGKMISKETELFSVLNRNGSFTKREADPGIFTCCLFSLWISGGIEMGFCYAKLFNFIVALNDRKSASLHKLTINIKK
jgi:hypothetical protein